jgi:hypothetical protein
MPGGGERDDHDDEEYEHDGEPDPALS